MDNGYKNTVAFSISPVQEFISQARRTRDYWAGSFLLSYLSGKAMEKIKSSGCEILVPDILKDPFYQYLIDRNNNSIPTFGSLPNVFLYRYNEEKDPIIISQEAEKCILDTWKTIAEKIWDHFNFNTLPNNENVKKIWNRQVEGFWDINWIKNTNSFELHLMKNWPHYFYTVEEGDKCTIMNGWQELSGYCSSKGENERIKQNEFWDSLRAIIKNPLLIRENEKLCSIALIKRLFPEITYDDAILGKEINTRNWLSTSYIAASSWIVYVEKNKRELANQYEKLFREKVSWTVQKIELKKIKIESISKLDENDFAKLLDGQYFYLNDLEFPRRTPFSNAKDYNPENENQELIEIRNKAKNILKKLYEEKTPSNFYAFITMDGDKIGELINDLNDKNGISGIQLVSSCLADFSKEVELIVKKNDGILVYAGGDDVAAFLSIKNVLKCAFELSTKFTEIFHQKITERKVTMSAGITFVHYNEPLRLVIKESHELLNDIAKTSNGRGSFAISILKGSGRSALWVNVWDLLINNSNEFIFEKIMNLMRLEDKQFSFSFFYKVRELIVRLSSNNSWKPGQFTMVGNLISKDILLSLIKRDREINHLKLSDDTLDEFVTNLLKLSYKTFRKENYDIETNENKICFDLMAIIKFISNNIMDDTF